MKIYTEDCMNKLINESNSIEEFKEKLHQSGEVLDADVVDAVEGEVIIVSFPADRTEEAVKLTQLLQSTYQNNPVIGLVDDVDVLIEQADEALEMLDGMKAKINIMRGTPTTQKIIV